MTKEEWKTRCAAQYMKRGGLTQEQANYDANARMWGLNAPWAPLQNYASIVYGGANPSTVSTSDGPSQKSGGGIRGALGGAASGAMMGNTLVPGAGGIVGGILGGLGGLFG